MLMGRAIMWPEVIEIAGKKLWYSKIVYPRLWINCFLKLC